MRLLIICLTVAACGLPPDIVGPTARTVPTHQECPTPVPGSGIEERAC